LFRRPGARRSGQTLSGRSGRRLRRMQRFGRHRSIGRGEGASKPEKHVHSGPVKPEGPGDAKRAGKLGDRPFHLERVGPPAQPTRQLTPRPTPMCSLHLAVAVRSPAAPTPAFVTIHARQRRIPLCIRRSEGYGRAQFFSASAPGPLPLAPLPRLSGFFRSWVDATRLVAWRNAYR
jgi:hypothetical protein